MSSPASHTPRAFLMASILLGINLGFLGHCPLARQAGSVSVSVVLFTNPGIHGSVLGLSGLCMTGTMTKLDSITVVQNMTCYVRHTLAE